MTLSPELITGLLSFLFTIMIFSYLLGDNPLFRIAAYVFVGVAAGYIAAVAFWQVLWPDLFYPMLFENGLQNGLLFVPLILLVLLLMKALPRISAIGAPAMAYLVGAGAAVAIGGAVIGTLTPQAFATINAFDLRASSNPLQSLFDGGLILVGVVTTLAYFHFGARAKDDGTLSRLAPIEWIAWVGRIFIAVTFGALFAGVYLAALTALVDRLFSMWDFIGSFL